MFIASVRNYVITAWRVKHIVHIRAERCAVVQISHFPVSICVVENGFALIG